MLNKIPANTRPSHLRAKTPLCIRLLFCIVTVFEIEKRKKLAMYVYSSRSQTTM